MNLQELKEQREAIERLNQPPERSYRRFRRERFDVSHQRVTTYLRKDLFDRLQLLRQSGRVTNLTEFFHLAVSRHLEELRE